jgi:hypothetical protein
MCEDRENYESQGHVKPWELVKLKPSNTQFAYNIMDKHDHEGDWEFGGEEGTLGNVPSIGDNFDVPTEVDNEEVVDFYVLQCQHAKFCVKEAFECIWGGRFDAGDSVVAGTYY